MTLNRSDDRSFPARYTAHFDTSPELSHRHALFLSVLKRLPNG